MENLNLCDIVQESLEWCEGQSSFAGMQRRVRYTAASNILVWPEREKTASGTELAAYKENSSFLLKADKKWNFIDILPTKSTSTSEPQGELPSGSQLNKLTLIHPGTGEKASNAAAYINNVPCVFLVEDMDGNWRVCGCPDGPARLRTPSPQTGGRVLPERRRPLFLSRLPTQLLSPFTRGISTMIRWRQPDASPMS